MASEWAQVPDLSDDDQRLLDMFEAMSAEELWHARVHYWAHIHGGECDRVLVVRVHSWLAGPHTYVVPVPSTTGLIDAHRRHREQGHRTDIVELRWSEFLTRFPRPPRDVIAAAVQMERGR